MYRYAQIGQRIQECRVLAELTQDDVARHCQCSRATVSAWERGKRPLTALNVLELAKLFDESADYILMGRRSPPTLSPILAEVFRRPGVMPMGAGFTLPAGK